MKRLDEYAKAIVGALVAAGSAYLLARSDNMITGEEIGTVVGAALTGLVLVWGVPNAGAKDATRR